MLYLEAILISGGKADENAAAMLLLVTLEKLPSSSPGKVAQWTSIVSGLPQQQKKAVRNTQSRCQNHIDTCVDW